MNEVWVVSYWKNGEEPVNTAFDNEENAVKCYEFFRKSYNCCIDKLTLYSTFTSSEEGNND